MIDSLIVKLQQTFMPESAPKHGLVHQTALSERERFPRQP